MPGNQTVLNDVPADEMFLDDALDRGRIAVSVPGAFRIDDRDGPAFADAQAVRFRAQDAALLRQSQLLQSPFEKIPRVDAAIFLAAFRIGLIAAEKNVPTGDRHADRVGDLLLARERCHGPILTAGDGFQARKRWYHGSP